MSDWVDVVNVEDFPPGAWRVVEVEGAAIAVFNVAGGYYAIEDVCTHDYGSLTGGDVCGTEVVCPRHGARFDIRTGSALSPPAYEPVATFPLRVSDGVLQVRDPRWD
jgi:3-phenylpropionate/trans-cinnamate dioxygenase ferredoxin subunit